MVFVVDNLAVETELQKFFKALVGLRLGFVVDDFQSRFALFVRHFTPLVVGVSRRSFLNRVKGVRRIQTNTVRCPGWRPRTSLEFRQGDWFDDAKELRFRPLHPAERRLPLGQQLLTPEKDFGAGALFLGEHAHGHWVVIGILAILEINVPDRSQRT
jgi:hypothetical protein